MNNPVEKIILTQTIEPFDPAKPERYSSETLSQLNGEIIEETKRESIKYLPNGIQVQKDTIIFHDPITGEFTDMASTFVCSGCFQRFSLKGLKMNLTDEKKQFCEPCWKAEKWSRRKKCFAEWIKKLMEPV